jgi:hypothetical protein
MIGMLIAFSLALVVVFSPGKKLFLWSAFALTGVYLFAANIPLSLFDVEEFIRYSKEPLILAVFLRFFFELWRYAVRRSGESATATVSSAIAWGRSAQFWFVVLFVWCALTVVQTGIAGLFGYIRGILFPAALLLYLSVVDDDKLRQVGDAMAIVSVVLVAFLFACALIHLYVDPQFLIPESFRNRLDYDLPYRTVVEYGSIRRYQSFFGDPNRTAIVCLIALWLTSIGRARRLRWPAYGLVAAILWFTQSRTGMLVAALWGLYLLLRPNPKRDLPAVSIIALILGVLAVGVWLFFSSRAGSLEEVSRAIIWFAIVQHIMSSPLLLLFGEGFGWVGQVGGTFNVSESIQLTSSSGRTLALSVVDNSYLTLLSSLGLIGTMAFVAFYRDVLKTMAARVSDPRQRRQFWILVALIALWSFFFDALVSFPWTFLFPVVLRYAASQSSAQSLLDSSCPASTVRPLNRATVQG